MSVRTNSPSADAVRLIDSTGKAFGLINNAGSPQVCSQNYLQAVAEGDITGHTPWSKIGYNDNVDVGTEDMIAQGGQYVFRTTETAMTLVSTNDNDGKTGGASCTGVRTVTLYYLDDEFTEKTEDITLDGTTAVNTAASDIYRVQNMHVKTCGTNGSALGNITLATGGVTYGYIAIGHTRMRQCVWTVPKSKTLYITSISFAVGGATKERCALFTALVKYDDKSLTKTTFFMAYAEIIIEDSAFYREFEIPTFLPAGVDLKVQVRGLTADCICTCSLRGWLE